MSVSVAEQIETHKKLDVKKYFHDVSFTGDKLIMVDRYSWDRVLSLQIMPLDQAMQVVRGQRRNESIIRFLRNKGHS